MTRIRRVKLTGCKGAKSLGHTLTKAGLSTYPPCIILSKASLYYVSLKSIFDKQTSKFCYGVLVCRNGIHRPFLKKTFLVLFYRFVFYISKHFECKITSDWKKKGGMVGEYGPESLNMAKSFGPYG